MRKLFVCLACVIASLSLIAMPCLYAKGNTALDSLSSSIKTPANIIWEPDPNRYNINTRLWQGCPTLEKTGERLWAAWFTGGTKEPDKGNYGVVAYSDNDGDDWIDPAMVIVHPDTNVRVMDTQIWKDPLGRLWLFWVQNYGTNSFDKVFGTWAIRIDNPDCKRPKWTKPRRLADGLTRNKVTVLSSGEWLLPSYDWVSNQSAIYISSDHGKRWRKLGGPTNEESYFFEHMTLELKDGTIWMLQRRMKESFSVDGGRTWSVLKDVPQFTAPDSRLFLRRLDSGSILLVYNDDPERKFRKNLVAVLSEDDGQTWPYKLTLDERASISYPDGVQDNRGIIYIAYDRSRKGDKEILMTTFTEEDIKAGKYISEHSRQKMIISKVPANQKN